jgi:predicted RNase H-like nuclease (RuvC/YqgF family)
MTESEKKVIIGFDIHPQSSPQSKRSPRYAIAIIQDDKIESRTLIRRSDLIKLIRQMKPYAIATDNLNELASSEKLVIDLLAKIPSKTRVIQVTGSPVHGMTSLTKLAKRYGFEINKHPSPQDTAILVARLAYLGVGIEIAALVRETRIVISRSRKIGPGGFSQSRYQRRMQGAVKQVSRSIIDRLSKAGLDFDTYETPTPHGLARCVIHVYDSFDNVNEIVHPKVNRMAGIAVKLSPVKRRAIQYLPIGEDEPSISPRQLLVVGIDAGTTVGIAIADVTGKLIALKSGRGLSRGDVIRYLVEFGKPVIIATDVAPAPTFIVKLSNSLQTDLFTPQRVLSVVEKRELAKSFTTTTKLRSKNAHQRDALAAISKVFQTYEEKYHLLQKRLHDQNQLNLFSTAASLVLQGSSVHEAIIKAEASVIQEDKSPVTTIETSSLTQTPSPAFLLTRIERLQRQMVSLQRQLDYERTQNQKHQKHLEDIQTKLATTQRLLDRSLRSEDRALRRDERIRQKEKDIKRLHQEIKNLRIELETVKRRLTNLKLMRQLEIRGEVQPVVVLPLFSQEEIRLISQRFSKKEEKVVYILDSSGGGATTADLLIQLGVKVILANGAMSHLALNQFKKAKIPVLDSKNLRITKVDEFAVVDAKQLEDQITRWKKRHSEEEKELAATALEQIIEEYRHERRSEEPDK